MADQTVTNKWVLVYTSPTWVVCQLFTGEVTTQETLELFDTEGECLARVAALSLTPRYPEDV